MAGVDWAVKGERRKVKEKQGTKTVIKVRPSGSLPIRIPQDIYANLPISGIMKSV